MKKVYLCLGVMVAVTVIFSAGFNAFRWVDTRHAHAGRVANLEFIVTKKKLSDEVFQLKILIAQENIFNGGQDSQALIWMKDQLGLKQDELKILLRKGQ